MLHEEKERAKNYDDFLDKLTKEHTESIDDAIEAVKEFEEKANRHHYVHGQFKPAVDAMYQTFKDQLQKEFGDDFSMNVHGEDNEKKAEKALYEALKKYMEMVRPEVLETIDELELNDDDALKKLQDIYDTMHGVNPNDPVGQGGGPMSIKYVLGAVKDKKGTLGDLLDTMASKSANDHEHAWNALKGKYKRHHISKFDKEKWLKHALGKVKDYDKHDIYDGTRMSLQSEDGLYNLVKAINYEDFEGVKLKQYGLEKKEE